MANLLPLFVVLVFTLICTIIVWRSRRFRETLRESLFRNSGPLHRNVIGILLGYLAATLLLSSGVLTSWGASWLFVGVLAAIMILLIVVRPNEEQRVDKFGWGLLVIINLGFGLGALIHGYREWWKWLWRQYLRINTYPELLLESLFLLGVILGFFVVRNWSKDQKEFVSSLSGVLGGAFLATILGEIQDQIGTMQAFAYYALGFTMSGTLNLIAAARLTANYTNRRTIQSRALLDFLYGSERAKTIDGYFLKNFEQDPDYAKRWLTDALIEFRKLTAREFSKGMESRRIERERKRDKLKTKLKEENKTIEKVKFRRRKLEPACSKLQAAKLESQELLDELEIMWDVPEQRSAKQEKKIKEAEKRLQELARAIESLNEKCSSEQLEEWLKLDEELNELKPSYYYELISIEGDDSKENDEADATVPVSPKDQEYSVVYRHIDSDQGMKIEERMFRIGVAIKWGDSLEYITAPGEYRATFPYLGSVSGLALAFRQTIVMDRDANKRLRSKSHVDGICPKDIEQVRGLDEIDFLSYVSIPIVSRLGTATENGVGVVTIDSKLFVTSSRLDGQPLKASEGIFRARMTPRQLTDYASYLFEQSDQQVKYLEDLAKIIVPVLELYAKCRVGAT